jgi:hypothetical protein
MVVHGRGGTADASTVPPSASTPGFPDPRCPKAATTRRLLGDAPCAPATSHSSPTGLPRPEQDSDAAALLLHRLALGALARQRPGAMPRSACGKPGRGSSPASTSARIALRPSCSRSAATVARATKGQEGAPRRAASIPFSTSMRLDEPADDRRVEQVLVAVIRLWSPSVVWELLLRAAARSRRAASRGPVVRDRFPRHRGPLASRGLLHLVEILGDPRLVRRRFLRVSRSVLSTSFTRSRDPRDISARRSFSAASAASIESLSRPSASGVPRAAAAPAGRGRPGLGLPLCHLSFPRSGVSAPGGAASGSSGRSRRDRSERLANVPPLSAHAGRGSHSAASPEE